MSSSIETGLQGTFPALKYRNYRNFWFSQCISYLGTWMQITAQQWLVYTLTKSALLLGLLGVAQFGPVMCLSLFAGVIVDRYPKKQILILTQTAQMIQALILAFLVWSGNIAYWQVLILATLLGLSTTLDIPTRHSFIPDLVERKDLIRSAIGLNMAVYHSARLIGPTLSAILMAQFGAGLLFFLNGISFLPVIIFLCLINTKLTVIKKAEKKILVEILEGLNYIRHSSVMLSTVLAMLVLSTLLLNFNVIIPVYATEALKQGVHGYGFLMSACGAGSLIGALLGSSKAMGHPKIQLLFGSALVASTLLVLLNFIHSLLLAIGLLAIIGFFTLIFLIIANSTLQLHSSDEFRGRVMSVYSLAFAGTTPIGNIFAGSLTDQYGSGMGFLICGVLSGFFIILTVIYYFRKRRVEQTVV